jgi:hypothetical protein
VAWTSGGRIPRLNQWLLATPIATGHASIGEPGASIEEWHRPDGAESARMRPWRTAAASIALFAALPKRGGLDASLDVSPVPARWLRP